MTTKPCHDYLYDAAAVRTIDVQAARLLGMPTFVLMQRAGAAAYAWLRRRWPQAARLDVFCGLGNNGGDGYILARQALQDGLAVRVLQVGDGGRLRGDAALAAQEYRQAGGLVERFQPGIALQGEVLVDALFGTGLARPLEGEWAAAVAALNAGGRPVLALDLPSGLHADTGTALGEAVTASATITFIAYKSGLLTGAGPALSGELVLADLGVPAAAFGGVAPRAAIIGEELVRAALPRRPRDAHKGRHGHVLVIGGDYGMAGAARLAAEAAGRVGAGLVTVATRAEHCAGLLAARPEAMCRGVASAADLEPLLQRATVVVLGPGLGQGDWGRALFEAALRFPGSLLLDADALNLLARQPRRNPRWVLTPHPGEAARLLGCSVAEVQADRYAAAVRLSERYGGVVVLKGAGTIVQASAALPWVCRAGNPGMGSGGMGDVLSGVIGGLLAQGLAAQTAAAVGVQVHGQAADRAAAAGERGLLAMDLMPNLRELVNPA